SLRSAPDSTPFPYTTLFRSGSLRQAILEANVSRGTDIIVFDASAYGTITLTSGELQITDCLFINGPGADQLAVNGNQASRVFHIDRKSTRLNSSHQIISYAV